MRPSLAALLGVCGCAAFLATIIVASRTFAADTSVNQPPSNKLGFIVWKWNSAIYQTKFWDECPQGAGISQDEVWWRSLPRDKRFSITRNGNRDANERYLVANKRGPNNEDVCWQPTLFKDPPVHEAQGPTSFGFNLDGTQDGHGTSSTCAHDKFSSSPDGDAAVDNQLYRILGCYIGWRNFQVVDSYANEARRASGKGLTLIEVSGVHDPRNDDDVTVSFYLSADRLPLDSAGNPIPYSSYRIDSDKNGPRYYGTTHGKIVNGVLQTEPTDVILPSYGVYGAYGEIDFHNMRLRLRISEDGATATGTMAGYRDVEKWFAELRDAEVVSSHGDFSCPAIYEAAHRLADGSRDPKTGKCTAISSAYLLGATAAFVIHTDASKEPRVQAGLLPSGNHAQ